VTVYLSHVVAQTGAFPYRLYMKAIIYEIIGYDETLPLKENRR